MRNVNYLVVHCSAGPQNQKVPAIEQYWKKSLGWSKKGYHVIVEADGTAHELVPIDQISNGVAGFNSQIINIAYIGGVDKKGKPVDNRTPEQKATILRYLKKWKKMFPKAIIQGHRDFSPDKNKNGIIEYFEWIKYCPCFDAKKEYANII
ncbi:N-acetylmuramoyl-L-alanine amidase [Dyadobacter sp. CY312]|uniref:N-acetylmuramoyl-L-alanine amidase n=1 Tax=Dyadobacter sp. CY312 TaxID=2907303 RepID=UPI001F238943|nr:N-acetylmuramoyl-L-alanine amidase [Dyadobacter sp. CY312]MCE7039257.1 N-acetylmuramoyl-L-alanine amidase [Dyadobacter sp. CY312]